MFYIIAIPLTIIVLVILGLAISVINLWVRALFAEAPVRIRDLIGMKLRRVPPTSCSHLHLCHESRFKTDNRHA